MLVDLKLMAMHSGCVLCLLAKIILTPIVKLAGWVEGKIATKKLETVK